MRFRLSLIEVKILKNETPLLNLPLNINLIVKPTAPVVKHKTYSSSSLSASSFSILLISPFPSSTPITFKIEVL